MGKLLSGSVLRDVGGLFDGGVVAGTSDGVLLEAFQGGPDGTAERAFAVLLERHGPMVFRVCRGVLGDEHESEDAFQATFLVLARRAGKLWRQESIGPWLYGVAYRVAKHARSDAARRSRLEREAAERRPLAVEERVPDGLEEALHEEIGRLPERFRSVVVLCDLEELSHDEAAKRLECPVGTVKSRLSRAREQLSGRLVRRGLAPASAALAGGLSSRSARAAVSPSLASATLQGAVRFTTGAKSGMAGIASTRVASLVKGGVRTMFWNKRKILGLIVGAFGLGVAGAGGFGWSLLAKPPAKVLAAASDAEAKKEAEAALPAQGWNYSPNVTLRLDKQTKHGGESSGSFTARPNPAAMLKTMLQAIAADDYHGKRVRLSAYVKSEGVNEWAGLWMRVDTDKNSPSFDNMMERPIKGTTAWTRRELVLDVPENSQIITLGLLAFGEGTLWIDDMAFEVVGKDVAVTKPLNPETPGFDAEAAAQIKQTYAMLRAQKLTKPVNLGFEPSAKAPVAAGDVEEKNGAEASLPVRGWDHSPNVTLRPDKQTKHGGESSGSFTARPNPAAMLKTMLQAIVADDYRGKRVRLSAYVKSKEVDRWAGLWMRVDTDKNSPSFDNMMDRPIEGTTNWTRRELVLDIPDNAQIITFGLLVDGEGRLWIDEMAFEIVGKEVATTKPLSLDMPAFDADAAAQIKQTYAMLRAQKLTKPVNLGFEP